MGIADLLIAPYLNVSDGLQVGPWDLVPLRQVKSSHVLPAEHRDQVLRLVEAYRLPGGGGVVLGAVVFPVGEFIGAPFEHADMAFLSRALLAGTLAANPLMAVPEETREANAGHAVASAENALLYGHPLNGGLSYALSTGALVRRLDLRYSPPGEALPKVEPPTDLPTPLFGAFDDEVANAAHAALEQGGSLGRRLHRSLDWYALCFSNATPVTPDARVVAMRCALEVLTGVGDETKKLVRAVGRLLAEDDTPLTTRCPFWAKGPVQLTSDEWWLTRLSELRNDIVHGDEVPEDLWQHERLPQLDHGHDALLRCLTAMLAEHTNDPLLTLPLGERMLARLSLEIARGISKQQNDLSAE